MITVYSKPNCAQCTMTKKVLDDNGISYTSIDVYENPEAQDRVKSLGFQSMPVVVADGHEPWFGFRPDRLAELVGGKEVYEKIVEMCPEDQGVSMKDGILTIFDHRYEQETTVGFGEVVIVEDGEMDVLSGFYFYCRYQIVEEAE